MKGVKYHEKLRPLRRIRRYFARCRAKVQPAVSYLSSRKSKADGIQSSINKELSNINTATEDLAKNPVNQVCQTSTGTASIGCESNEVFRLLDLPSELVDTIIACSIRSSEFNILCTSRQMYKRARPLIYENRVFHMSVRKYNKLEYYFEMPKALPTQMAAMAQHIKVKVLLNEAFSTDPNTGVLRAPRILPTFTQFEPRRKTCTLMFIYNHNESPENYKPINLLQVFKSFKSFEVVFVEVAFKYLHQGARPLSSAELRSPLLRTKNKLFYKMLISELEPELGAAVWKAGNVEGGQYLEFRPGKHSKDASSPSGGGKG